MEGGYSVSRRARQWYVVGLRSGVVLVISCMLMIVGATRALAQAGPVAFESEVPDDGICDRYFELDQTQRPCGPRGYAQAMGGSYCRRFSALGPADLSDRGLHWRDATRICLIDAFEALVMDDEPLTCRQIRNRAFASHPPCYVDPDGDGGVLSFCQLPPRDVLRIVAVVAPQDLLSPLALQQNIAIVTRCAEIWTAADRARTAGRGRAAFWRELRSQLMNQAGTVPVDPE